MDINIGSHRQGIILNSSEYLNRTGELFLLQADSHLNGNVVTASQAEPGFVIMPLISLLTNLNVDYLANILFLFLILISLLVSLYSSIKLSTNLNSKIFSFIFFIFLIFLSYPLYLNEYAEYSLHYFFGLLAIYPIYLISKKNIKPLNFLIQICIVSLISIIYGLFRDYVYLSLSITFFFILLKKVNSKKFFKLTCILILISPIFITQTVSKNVSDIMNDNYREIITNNPENKFYKNIKGDILLGQSVWHSLYVSFAFLKNDIVKGSNGYDDQTIRDLFNRDSNVDWHFYSSDDDVIKKKIIQILLNNPILVFKTFFAKLGIILGYVLVIANIGLLIFINSKLINENKLVVLFLSINLMVASIFPMIAIPSKIYLGGVFSSSFLIFYLFILKFLNKSKLK